VRINRKVFSETLAFPFTSLDLSSLCARAIVEDMDMDGDVAERRVQARFITKLKPPYKVPNTSVAIPANVTRYGLSTIVNTLLKASA
jgi:hypothetical protein